MNRLFWRIFGGFWLLLLALTAATLAINYVALGPHAPLGDSHPFDHAGFGLLMGGPGMPLGPMPGGPGFGMSADGPQSDSMPDGSESGMHRVHRVLPPHGSGGSGPDRWPVPDFGPDHGAPLLFDVGGILNKQGVPGVERFFESLERTRGASFSLFDSNGRFLCGKPATRVSRSLVWQAIRSDHSEVAFDHSAMLHASPIVGDSHKRYVIVDSLAPPATNWPAILVRALGALLIATLICWWLAAQITRPVQVLRGATRDIALGKLATRTAPQLKGRRDELGMLGQDFDQMAGKLENLIIAQIRLMADISHELRSPLARLTLAAAVARRATGEEVVTCLDRVDQEAERLNDLIGQLTALSQLDLATVEPNRQPINLIDLVGSVVESASYEADEKQCEIVMATEGSVAVLVDGDGELLLRAIENVIRNAVRYTASGTRIDVRVSSRQADRIVKVVVTDCGPGVPDGELDSIFNPFYRTSLARDRETGGVGLGLTIARRAVIHHGGSITASNRVDGVTGLEVCVALPCAFGDSADQA